MTTQQQALTAIKPDRMSHAKSSQTCMSFFVSLNTKEDILKNQTVDDSH